MTARVSMTFEIRIAYGAGMPGLVRVAKSKAAGWLARYSAIHWADGGS